MDSRPNLRYAIPYEGEEIWPEKQWQWSRERALTALVNDELVIKKVRGSWSVNYKQYLRSANGEERGSKLYSIVDSIYTQQGTNEINAMLGNGKAFDFPKPSALIKKLVLAFTHKDSLVLDSFAGSGTTGHGVMAANAEDNGHRRFILVEMDQSISRNVTAERVRRIATGYTNKNVEKVPGLGGGFQFCRLSREPLFTPDGRIREDVRFAELAEFVWFAETGTGYRRPKKASPLLGVHEGRAIYLLYNGILGDRSADGGNVLTGPVLDLLPAHDGPRIVYAAACRLGMPRLQREGIVFKQTPYALDVAP